MLGAINPKKLKFNMAAILFSNFQERPIIYCLAVEVDFKVKCLIQDVL